MKINGQKIDRLVTIDKHAKINADLVAKYPLLRIIFNEDLTPKSYSELKQEFDEAVSKPNMSMFDKYALSSLFSFIIAADPMLTMDYYITNGEYSSAFAYIIRHPSMFDEYPEELRDITDRCSDPMLNRLFNKGFNISMGTGMSA
jgi:hypothetical protein